jgi:hypothetical protein
MTPQERDLTAILLDRLNKTEGQKDPEAEATLVHVCLRRVEFSQAVKPAMTQPPEQPAFDDQHRGFDPSLRWGRLLALSRGRRGRAGRTAVP